MLTSVAEYLVGLRLLEDAAEERMPSSRVTGRSAELQRCAHESTWTAPT